MKAPARRALILAFISALLVMVFGENSALELNLPKTSALMDLRLRYISTTLAWLTMGE